MNINTNEYQPASLEDLGWNPFFQKHYLPLETLESLPARVISESRGSFQVYCQHGELFAGVSGRMRYHAGEEKRYPAVGDWVIIKPFLKEHKATIHTVLPRKSCFSRKVSGERTEKQIVSANIDTAFIVSSLDGGRNFNLRRIERYLTLAWNSGAIPVLVLNKEDLCYDTNIYINSIENIAPGVTVHTTSARQKTGLSALKKYLTRGNTAAFLGSSGVGKSALINALLGIEKQLTREVREDDRTGRHTTTRRELFLLPGGGIVIDTPGMRELQLWAGEEDIQGTFPDIENLAGLCRFKNCNHRTESGCAIKAAIKQGELDQARLDSYLKLQNESDYLVSKEKHSARQYEKQKWKKIAKLSKELKKNRPR